MKLYDQKDALQAVDELDQAPPFDVILKDAATDVCIDNRRTLICLVE